MTLSDLFSLIGLGVCAVLAAGLLWLVVWGCIVWFEFEARRGAKHGQN